MINLGRGDPDGEVLLAWQCYQQVRSAHATTDLATGKKIAEIARLGSTLRQWKHTYLGYFTTERSNNGGTEAIGVIELHRRIARGYRNRHNYRLRMLLVAAGSTPNPHQKSDEPDRLTRHQRRDRRTNPQVGTCG